MSTPMTIERMPRPENRDSDGTVMGPRSLNPTPNSPRVRVGGGIDIRFDCQVLVVWIKVQINAQIQIIDKERSGTMIWIRVLPGKNASGRPDLAFATKECDNM
jgi:hypothetical protein